MLWNRMGLSVLWNRTAGAVVAGLLFCLPTHRAAAQRTEVYINAYTGFFSFHGPGATAASQMNQDHSATPQKYTSDPYGNKNSGAYAFELQGLRVTRSKWLAGVGAAFESLTSLVGIDTMLVNTTYYGKDAARGKTTLRNTFITLNPFFGRRFVLHRLTLDLEAGLDLGFCLDSRERGNSIWRDYNPNLAISIPDYIVLTIVSDNKRPTPFADLRPRIQAAIRYDRFGVLLGYSYGLTGYQAENDAKAYTGFLRLGLSARIR